MENLLFLPKISKAEQIELVKQARQGNKIAKDKLVLSCVGMIKKRIMQLINKNSWNNPLFSRMYEDLLNTGILGVLYAFEKFDISRDTSFSSYALFWIDKFLQKQFYVIRKVYCSQSQNALDETVPDDKNEAMFDAAFNRVLCRQLLAAVGKLEREVIILSFGFNCRCHTLTEIAEQYGFSFQYIGKVKQRALQKMRNNYYSCALKCA